VAHLLQTAVERPAHPALTSQRSPGPWTLRGLAVVLFVEWAAGTMSAALAAGVAAASIPVTQPIGAGIIGWATVLAIALVAVLPLWATVALWRQASRMRRLRGSGRVAVAAAAGVNLLAGLAGILGLRSVDTVALALPAVAIGLLVGYGCVLALLVHAREPADAPAARAGNARPRPGPAGATLLAGILVPAIYAASAVVGWLQYRSFAIEVEPPPELTVCTGEMDHACAVTAAGGSGLTVAWLPGGDRVRPLYTLLEPRFVQQDFETTGRVEASLFTALDELPAMGEPSRTVRIGEATGQVRIAPVEGDQWSVIVDWARAGVHYRLSTYPPGATGPDEAIDQAADLAGRVRYAAPPPGQPPAKGP
jgi:hypothetical protein